MEAKEIKSTIDYCMGRIKSYEHALLPVPYQAYDPIQAAKNRKKLKHYKLMLKALLIVQEQQEV